MLNIKDLHKSYDMGETSLHVLKGINLKVEEGEMVGQVLKRTEYWWIESNFTKNKRSCLDFASKYLPGSVGR